MLAGLGTKSNSVASAVPSPVLHGFGTKTIVLWGLGVQTVAAVPVSSGGSSFPSMVLHGMGTPNTVLDGMGSIVNNNGISQPVNSFIIHF